MRIVDTHCHSTPMWYEPVESLLFQMDKNQVEQAVLIQINGYYDNDYQFEAVRRYSDRLASVVLVDVQQPDAVDELARCFERGARGVRFNPNTRSPGDDPLAIWRKAEKLGLAVAASAIRPSSVAEEFASVVKAVPNLSIIVEHLGGMKAADPPEEAALHEQVFALPDHANVCMKIHGLGEFCTRQYAGDQPVSVRPGRAAVAAPCV